MFFALAHILVSYLFCFNLQPCKTHLDKILILFTKLLKSNNYQIVFCYFIYFIVFLAFSDLTRFPCIDFWAKKWTFPAIEKRPKFHEFSFLFQVSCHKLRDIFFRIIQNSGSETKEISIGTKSTQISQPRLKCSNKENKVVNVKVW